MASSAFANSALSSTIILSAGPIMKLQLVLGAKGSTGVFAAIAPVCAAGQVPAPALDGTV